MARTRAPIFGEEPYPDLETKAAAAVHSIVTGHALVDGNKRLGWLATAVFLEINGASVATASNDDVVDLVMSVATGEFDLAEIALRLAELADAR